MSLALGWFTVSSEGCLDVGGAFLNAVGVLEVYRELACVPEWLGGHGHLANRGGLLDMHDTSRTCLFRSSLLVGDMCLFTHAYSTTAVLKSLRAGALDTAKAQYNELAAVLNVALDSQQLEPLRTILHLKVRLFLFALPFHALDQIRDMLVQ